MNEKISSRVFLKCAGSAAAVLALTACGGSEDDAYFPPVPATPEPGTKNTTDLGTLDVQCNGAATSNQKVSADRRYLVMHFTFKNLKSEDQIVNRSAYSIDIGSGVVGFGKLSGNLNLDTIQSTLTIPQNGTEKSADVLFDITGAPFDAKKKDKATVTFTYNNKKIVYTLTAGAGALETIVVKAGEVTDV